METCRDCRQLMRAGSSRRAWKSDEGSVEGEGAGSRTKRKGDRVKTTTRMKEGSSGNRDGSRADCFDIEILRTNGRRSDGIDTLFKKKKSFTLFQVYPHRELFVLRCRFDERPFAALNKFRRLGTGVARCAFLLEIPRTQWK